MQNFSGNHKHLKNIAPSQTIQKGFIMKNLHSLFTLALILLTAPLLNAQETARLQVIHNAADPGAAIVDIYIDDALLIDDFGFRKASPFIDAPANTEFVIGVAPPNSSSAADAIAQIPVTLEANETYVAIANGVLDPTMFSANPDGIETGFQLLVKAGAREMGMMKDKVDFFVLHGATDAPAVDVLARGVGALVEGAAYSAITDYISVTAANYILDIIPAGANETIVATFDAPLASLGGDAAVVFASGFLSPAGNQNGTAFGLFAALPTGDVITLIPPTGTNVNQEHNATIIINYELRQNYPNPFNPTTTITFAVPERANVSVVVYDILGQEITRLLNEEKSAGAHSIIWNGQNSKGFQAPSGAYILSLQAGDFNQVRKMTLLK
jgi:hypothetical protein